MSNDIPLPPRPPIDFAAQVAFEYMAGLQGESEWPTWSEIPDMAKDNWCRLVKAAMDEYGRRHE